MDLSINNMVSATSLQIFDNTAYSGATIGIITLGAKAVQPFTMEYNVPFYNGLAISGTGTWDITVSYE
jgi:hypothetical protein